MAAARKARLAAVRSSTVVRAVVRSAQGDQALQASLRRLGADERTIAAVDGARAAARARQ